MSRPPRSALAALATACVLTVAGCASDQYVGSGDWTLKPEVQTPQGQAPGTPEQTPPPTTTDPQDPTKDPNVRATGLDQPWAVVGLPDGTALVGERTTGNVTRVFAQPEVPQQFAFTVPGVDGSGEGGLLGLAVPPNYLETGLIYAYLTTATDNRVVSLNAAGVAVPIVTGIPKGVTHNGGALAVAPDGTIVIGTGDTGNPAVAGDMSSLGGKVLMVNQFGDPVAGASPIVQAGFTDPTGLCVGEASGYLIDAGAGPSGGMAGNALYTVGPSDGLSGLTPLISYTGETAGAAGCVTGGTAIIVTGLDSQSLMTSILDANGAPTADPELSLTGTYGRLRAIGVDIATGGIWVATYNRDGIGQPAADDDKVLLLPPPAGGGGGDVS